MKKIMLIFLILGLLATNSIYAYVPPDEPGIPQYYVPVYSSDSGDNTINEETNNTQNKILQGNTTIEETNNTQNKILQGNTTTPNNISSIEDNNTQALQNNSQIIGNSTKNYNLIKSSMENTANPLIMLLFVCILIPIGIHKRK